MRPAKVNRYRFTFWMTVPPRNILPARGTLRSRRVLAPHSKKSMRNRIIRLLTAIALPILSGCSAGDILTYGNEESAWKVAREKGRAAFLKQDYKQAEEQYVLATRYAKNQQATNPGHLAETLQDLAEVYEKEGQLDKAKENYQAALAMTESMLNSTQASELYLRIVRLAKLRAHMALGNIYTSEKDYDKAQAAFEEGLKIQSYRSSLYPAISDLKEAYATMLDKSGRKPDFAITLHAEAKKAREGFFEGM